MTHHRAPHPGPPRHAWTVEEEPLPIVPRPRRPRVASICDDEGPMTYYFVKPENGRYYWIWQDMKTRRHPEAQPCLVVAQAYINDEGTLHWEGCGTDEGVAALSVVSMVEGA